MHIIEQIKLLSQIRQVSKKGKEDEKLRRVRNFFEVATNLLSAHMETQ
jgi:hypothetical protein